MLGGATGAAVRGASICPSPYARNFEPYHLPRIQAVDRDLDYWLTYFDRNPGERFVGDGDPGTITVASGSTSKLGAVAEHSFSECSQRVSLLHAKHMAMGWRL